jgi:drug/metabolite transporter (DMT)-like permease
MLPPLPPILSSRAAHVVLLLVAVSAVAVADVCLKQATRSGSLGQALRSPWTVAAAGLYLLQIVLFVVVFVSGWKLSVVGLLQTALYALVTLAAGLFLFGEALSTRQMAGLVLTGVGVLMLTR